MEIWNLWPSASWLSTTLQTSSFRSWARKLNSLSLQGTNINKDNNCLLSRFKSASDHVSFVSFSTTNIRTECLLICNDQRNSFFSPLFTRCISNYPQQEPVIIFRRPSNYWFTTFSRQFFCLQTHVACQQSSHQRDETHHPSSSV